MDQINKNQKNAQPGKKTERNDRGDNKRDISSGSKSRPEIDLPLKGGRSESDMASKNPSRHDNSKSNERNEKSDRSDRNDHERSSR